MKLFIVAGGLAIALATGVITVPKSTVTQANTAIRAVSKDIQAIGVQVLAPSVTKITKDIANRYYRHISGL